MSKVWRHKSSRRVLFWNRLGRQAHYRAGMLARLYGVTPRQLERIFHDEFDMGPKAWLCARRVEAAQQMILAGRPFAEIARRLDYKQVAHFSRDFKQRYHRTPSEFRSEIDVLKLRCGAS